MLYVPVNSYGHVGALVMLREEDVFIKGNLVTISSELNHRTCNKK